MKESKGLGDITGKVPQSLGTSLTLLPSHNFHRRCTSPSPPTRERLAAQRKIQALINKGFSFPNYETI